MAYKESDHLPRTAQVSPRWTRSVGLLGGHRHRQVPSCLRDMAGCLPQDDQRQVVGRLSREETVIFDDFKGSSMRLHDFQLIVDRYPVKVETKGSTVELSATRLVFTSNKHPSEWYSEDADPEGTVMRRINEFCADEAASFTSLGRTQLVGTAWSKRARVKLEVGVIGPDPEHLTVGPI